MKQSGYADVFWQHYHEGSFVRTDIMRDVLIEWQNCLHICGISEREANAKNEHMEEW